MSGFLLDTNVVSELGAREPEPRVIAFLGSQPDLWLSVIVVHELHFGLNQLPLGHRRDRLTAILSAFVEEYDDRILAVGSREVYQAAVLRAQARRAGRVLNLADGLIAGTALVHGLRVATRNTADFANHGMEVANPRDTR